MASPSRRAVTRQSSSTAHPDGRVGSAHPTTTAWVGALSSFMGSESSSCVLRRVRRGAIMLGLSHQVNSMLTGCRHPPTLASHQRATRFRHLNAF